MIYLLEIAMFQLLFLTLYYMFKKETFFNYNRIYLLGTSVLSYVLPFVKFDAFETTSLPINAVNMLPTVFIGDTTKALATPTNTHLFSWYWWYIPVLGSLVMLTVFVVKLRKLYKLSKSEKTLLHKTISVFSLKNSNTAFSFFNWIFMGELLKKEEKQIILEHEIIHVKQKHSIDLLFFEIQRIVCWFNPMVYVYQNEIKAVHEFIVDQQMIQKTGANTYCQNLLTQLFNTPKFTFVNTFYKQSIIKKRIAMITKKESKSTARLKYAFIIPVLMGMLFYTSCQQNEKVVEEKVEGEEYLEEIDGKIYMRKNISEETKTKVYTEGIPFAAVQNPAIFPGCEDAEDLKKCFSDKLSKHISKNFDIGLAEELGLVGIQRFAAMFKIDGEGNVTGIQIKGKTPEVNKEFERVLESLPKMEPATQDGEKVNMLFSLPLVFRVGAKDAKTAEKK